MGGKGSGRPKGSKNKTTTGLENDRRPRARRPRYTTPVPMGGVSTSMTSNPSGEVDISAMREDIARRAAKTEAAVLSEVPLKPGDGDWKIAFLAALRNSSNTRVACEAAGISRNEAYRIKARDQIFSDAWDEAVEDAIDILEAEAWQRARTQSDAMLMFMLKHKRPAVFLPSKQVEHSGPGGGAIPLALIDSVIAEHGPTIIEGQALQIEEPDDDAE